MKGRELQTPQTTAGESGNVRGVSQRHAAPILSPRQQAERRVFGTRGMFRELSHMVQELRREDEDLVLLQQKKKKLYGWYARTMKSSDKISDKVSLCTFLSLRVFLSH